MCGLNMPDISNNVFEITFFLAIEPPVNSINLLELIWQLNGASIRCNDLHNVNSIIPVSQFMQQKHHWEDKAYVQIDDG